jgi:hypothetical protein
MRGFFAALRMTNKEQTTTNTGVLHFVQDDDFKEIVQARMTISNGLRSWPDDNEWARFIVQFLGKWGETDLWWGSVWV